MNNNDAICKYCKDYTIEGIPIKSNWDTSWMTILIAQGENKKELVVAGKDIKGTMGIEINYCPMCGRKLV